MMFVDYLFARSPDLPPLPPCLYQYVVAANGVFARAWRPGLSVMIPLSAGEPLKGLADLQPYFSCFNRIDVCFLNYMLNASYEAVPHEILFYLLLAQDRFVNYPYKLVVPRQVQSSGSVKPVDPFNANASQALFEIHSHHNMAAFFSAADNRDEQGFKIYAVLGDISTSPAIRVRVGVYGHFWPIPAHWIFDMPAGLKDMIYADNYYSIDAPAKP